MKREKISLDSLETRYQDFCFFKHSVIVNQGWRDRNGKINTKTPNIDADDNYQELEAA